MMLHFKVDGKSVKLNKVHRRLLPANTRLDHYDLTPLTNLAPDLDKSLKIFSILKQMLSDH